MMRTEYIFYTVGVIFAIAAVLYFTWEYLFELARELKVAALVLLTLFFWFLANELRERDV
jgi:tryptophan-rich sensory protein